jgi:hypothetical protein
MQSLRCDRGEPKCPLYERISRMLRKSPADRAIASIELADFREIVNGIAIAH